MSLTKEDIEDIQQLLGAMESRIMNRMDGFDRHVDGLERRMDAFQETQNEILNAIDTEFDTLNAKSDDHETRIVKLEAQGA